MWRGIARCLVSASAVAGFAAFPSSGPRTELVGFDAGAWSVPEGARWVGSEKCAACHVEHARRQETHHMALTGRAVNEATREIWFSEERLAKPVDWRSLRGEPAPRFQVEGDRVYLEASQGDRVHRAPVAAVFGSGIHGMTPIAVAPDRAIRELRLSFSSFHDRWFTTPGSEGDPDPLGTPKSAEQSRECLSCHATVLSWKGDLLDVPGTVFGVGCERCHGPGSAHVEAVTSSASDPMIFNPGSLRPDRQVEFCGQCHRQPADVEPLDAMLRAPGLARHAGASLMMSACYRASPPESRISCLDCHDPHQNIERAEEATRKACLGCHPGPESVHWSERVSAASDCASCHMPVQGKGFHGMTFTDHWIREPQAPPPLGGPDENDILRYLEEGYRRALGRPRLGAEKSAALRIYLGEVLYGLESYDAAFEWLREGLSFSPSYRQRLKAAGMFGQAGKREEAASILEEAADSEPELLEAHHELGRLLQSQGRLDEAIRRYQTALATHPDAAAVHRDLGAALVEKGELERAISHLRRAVETTPEDGEARAHLGIALGRSGAFAEADEHLREAARLRPSWPAPLHALAGVLLAQSDSDPGSMEEAVRLADRAAQLTRYEHPWILDTLAAAYAAAGRPEKAVAVAEEALALARAAGEAELARRIEERLAAYRRETPQR